MYQINLTAEQLSTIKTALMLEMERQNSKEDSVYKMLKDASNAVDNFKITK